MKTKVGFIVKAAYDGRIMFHHLTSFELHLISKISGDADNRHIELKKVFYKDENQFILMKF